MQHLAPAASAGAPYRPLICASDPERPSLYEIPKQLGWLPPGPALDVLRGPYSAEVDDPGRPEPDIDNTSTQWHHAVPGQRLLGAPSRRREGAGRCGFHQPISHGGREEIFHHVSAGLDDDGIGKVY